MQIEKHAKKLLVRNIQQTDILKYITSQAQKKALNYPENCIKIIKNTQKQIIAVDCQMVDTQNGSELVRVLMVDQLQKTIYDKWFLPSGKNIQYLSHINGITETILNQHAKDIYKEQDQHQIMKLLSNKIMVGHDLVNDLTVMKIQHHTFIDTVALLPHNFGLPFKNKLKSLVMQMLGLPIQWNTHDPAEDAIAALRIVLNHVALGKGTIQQVQFIERLPQSYKDVWQILKEAQLDKQKVKALFLRGSRALDLVVDTKDYKSDWDYVCVYDTDAPINGRLVKLPQIDISLFDAHTFDEYLKNNDISYMELFFMPKQCQIVNKLVYPQISLHCLRQSLGYHLSKCKMKMARFKGDCTKQWKILKSAHLKMRFIDQFQQYLKYGQIKDIKAMNPIWKQMQIQFKKTNNLQKILKQANTRANQMLKQVRLKFQTKRKLRHHQKDEKKQFHKSHKQKQALGRTIKQQIIDQKQYLSRNNIKQYQNQKNNYSDVCSQQLQIRSGKKCIQRIYNPRIHALDNSSSCYNFNPLHQKLALVKQLQQNSFINMDQYKIVYRRGTKHSNLIQFHCLQSASFFHPICRQARGIILDQSRDFSVVALPYQKFFDYNDPKYSQQKKFDFENYKIYQKQDGSMAILYFYDGTWQVASSKIPDGQANYCFARKQTTTTFRNQFWKIFNQLKYELPAKVDSNKTFIFQLMSKNHIIVVNRQKNQLVLHGVKNIDTLQEQDFQVFAHKYGWRSTQNIQLKISQQKDHLSQIVQTAQSLNPTKHQGFILVDHKFTRLKVKNSGYVRINWLGQLNMTINKDPSRYILIEIVLSGEAQTFCKYCPQWQKVINQYISKIWNLNKQVCQIYDQLKKMELSDKQFAIKIQKVENQLQPFLFSVKKNEKLYYGRAQHSMTPKSFYKYITNYNI